MMSQAAALLGPYLLRRSAGGGRLSVAVYNPLSLGVELSVLFDLADKFCMRTRMEASHIGELCWEQVKRKGFIRDHWLTFGVGFVILKYFPFFNYYFGVKVFGTSMWCCTMWTGLNRFIAKTCRRNEYMAVQKTAQDVMEGEDAIVASMRRFANDAKCVEYLGTFKADTESKIASYRGALAAKMKEDLAERALKQLQAILHTVAAPSLLACPFCAATGFKELAFLQRHIASQHLPKPLPHVHRECGPGDHRHAAELSQAAEGAVEDEG